MIPPSGWRQKLQRLYRERHLLGLTVSEHPLAIMRPWLDRRGFITARALRDLPAWARVKLAGEVVIVHTPPQRDGRRVIFVTMEDETGLIDVALFPSHQGRNARVMLAHPLILVWGQLSRRGEKDNLVVVHRVDPPPLKLPGSARAAPRGIRPEDGNYRGG